MGKIPEANFGANRISTNFSATPYQSADAELANIQAYSNLGQSAAQLGGVLAQKRQEAERKDFLSRMESDFSLDLTKKDEELRTQFAGNYKGYAETKKKFIDDYGIAASKDAIDDYTKDKVSSYFSEYAAKDYQHSFSFENQQIAAVRGINHEKNQDKRITAAVASLKYDVMGDNYNSMLTDDAGELGLGKSQQQIEASRVEYADKMAIQFNRAVNNVPGSRMSALLKQRQFLNGEVVEAHNVYASMSSDTLSKLRAENAAHIEQETNKIKALNKNELNGFIEYSNLGNESTPAVWDRMEKIASSTASEDGGALLAYIKHSKKLNESLVKINQAPPDEREAIAIQETEKNKPKDHKNFHSINAANEAFKATVKKNIDNIYKNTGSYYSDNDSSGAALAIQSLDIDAPVEFDESGNKKPHALEKYMRDQVAFLDTKNVKAMPGLTPEQSKFFNRILSGAESGAEYDKMYQDILKNAGPYAPQVAASLQSKEAGSPVTEMHNIIAGLDQEAVRVSLYNATMYPKKYEPLNSDEKTAVQSAMENDEDFKTFKASLDFSGSDQQVKSLAYSELVMTQTKARMRLKNEDVATATKAAIQDILHGVDYSTKGNSEIALTGYARNFKPKIDEIVDATTSYSANPAYIQELMKGGVSEAYYQKLQSEGKGFGFSKERISEGRAEYLKKNGKFILDSSGTNLRLMVKDVQSGLPAQVFDAEDKPIVIPLTSLGKTISAMRTGAQSKVKERLEKSKVKTTQTKIPSILGEI